MLINVLGTEDDTKIYIPIPENLTPEGVAVYILKTLLDKLRGKIVDENNRFIIDSAGNYLGFDNSTYYPELPLSLWRITISGNIFEFQIVFFRRYV